MWANTRYANDCITVYEDMKIGIYSHSIAPSIDGVCRRFTSIMHELVRQGHEIILFTMEAAPEDLPSSTFTVLLDHMTFPQYPQKKAAKPTISTFMYILRQLKHFQPAVINEQLQNLK